VAVRSLQATRAPDDLEAAREAVGHFTRSRDEVDLDPTNTQHAAVVTRDRPRVGDRGVDFGLQCQQVGDVTFLGVVRSMIF
jgi:hypothetical protein